jgi:hypothetical protein
MPSFYGSRPAQSSVLKGPAVSISIRWRPDYCPRPRLRGVGK